MKKDKCICCNKPMRLKPNGQVILSMLIFLDKEKRGYPVCFREKCIYKAHLQTEFNGKKAKRLVAF